MKKIQSNCWIDDDETYVQSYTTKVATIDHNAQTVTALGWWSQTTQRHIRGVARTFGYRDIDNFRRIWYPPPKRVSRPKPAMKDGYTSIMMQFSDLKSRSSRKVTYYGSPTSFDHLMRTLIVRWNVYTSMHNNMEALA